MHISKQQPPTIQTKTITDPYIVFSGHFSSFKLDTDLSEKMRVTSTPEYDTITAGGTDGMGTTNDEAYLCLKALASSVRRNKSLTLPLIRHVIHNL